MCCVCKAPPFTYICVPALSPASVQYLNGRDVDLLIKDDHALKQNQRQHVNEWLTITLAFTVKASNIS